MAAETTEWSVRRVLDWTIGYLRERGSESPRLEAEILLAHACGKPRIWLYTHFEEVMLDDVRARMRELVKRRGNSEPVAYLVGYREFFSLRFEVAPGVFIPRPETETLVVESLAILKSRMEQGETQPTILDLCTGSGAIAVSIGVNQPAAQVTAVERSDAAFRFAKKNSTAQKVDERVTILQGNLFEPLSADSRFDVIVSNPPYVTTGDVATLANDVKNYEPVEALDGGADGLDVVRKIAAESSRFLKPKGSLLLEISPEQAVETAEILTSAGFQNVAVVKDLAGAARVVKGNLPS